MAIYHFRSQLGEQHARELLVRYHSELKGEPASFRRFVRTDLDSLLTNALPALRNQTDFDSLSGSWRTALAINHLQL